MKKNKRITVVDITAEEYVAENNREPLPRIATSVCRLGDLPDDEQQFIQDSLAKHEARIPWSRFILGALLFIGGFGGLILGAIIGGPNIVGWGGPIILGGLASMLFGFFIVSYTRQ